MEGEEEEAEEELKSMREGDGGEENGKAGSVCEIFCPSIFVVLHYQSST